ncbi:major facilitator superfamily domain-containing protein [Mycena pura]|uniref:Major facilitator superfamily domain-containing protein n=1 Tax=Mycena pura TaxID=153505 RepID=A0AAD6VRV8_9AGAR|nr:major facilitator superfamily domain-containing protein [Mycena pura]
MSSSPEGTLNGSAVAIPSIENEKGMVQEVEDLAVEDDFPHGLRLALLMVALCLSVFLVALAPTAIPHITDQFKSLDDVGWYGSAYLLAISATQLLFGKFYTFLPMKWVYLTAITLFEIGSAVCGAAPNSNALIVGRAIAGFGSAGIFTGALIIIAHSVPLAKRPVYTGLLGAMYGIASVAGPLMGGAFTDKVSWRWCFYINLPIGAVTIFVMIFIFKVPKSAKHKPQTMSLSERINQFDPWGTLVFIPAVVSLLLALQWGGSKYPWHNGRIIALFVVFGVLISFFVAVQLWKQDNATVPPRVFKARSIWSGALFAFSLGAGFFVLVFYIPIWFQAIKGVSAVKSGIDNIPMILSLVLASMLSGALITMLGYYAPFMIASSVLMSVGAGLLSTFTTHTGHARWIGYQVIFGLGLGMGMQQPIIAAQTVLPLADVPVGTSIIMFAQTLGGALFLSVGENVFANRLAAGLVARVPGVSPAIVLQAGATSLKTAVDPAFLPAVLEVYNDALMGAFDVSVAMCALSLVGALVIEWKSVKGKNIEMAIA